MKPASAPTLNTVEASAVLQLRVVLARARVNDIPPSADASPSALASAIATSLEALGVDVQQSSAEAEWGIACSPEIYEDRAIIEALILISQACASRRRPDAARGVMIWLRNSVEDARIVDLLWRLMQIEAGVRLPDGSQAGAASGDGFGELIAAMAQYPSDPKGAIGTLQSLRWGSSDPQLRDLALFLSMTLDPNRPSVDAAA